jgi:UDP-N-acetylglucosamine--N-acetylmuramyl-(pentapeptide) pyrophosphoryl-undecaprenol N-acetylglucosamine transferase
MKKKDIIIVAGGTGGHIYPAVRIYQEFSKKSFSTIFLTPKKNKGVSDEVLRDIKNIVFFDPPEIKLSFYFISKSLPTLLSSIKLIKDAKAVISTGGYSALYPLLVANIMRKKIFLVEINSIPGEAIKFYERSSHKIFCTFELTSQKLSNGITVGPIIREEFIYLYPTLSKENILKKFNLIPNIPTLLVIGGSQGAKHINDVILEIIENKLIIQQNIIWITGDKFFKENRYKLQSVLPNLKVFPYMEDIWLAYKCADLIISRAGASTISEILFLQKKAILIPYPYSADDHQYYNANEAIKKIGGIIIQDRELSPQKLIDSINILIKKQKKAIGFSQDGAKLITNYISSFYDFMS